MDERDQDGRLFQDVRFEVTHLSGCAVEELRGVIAYDDDLQPALVLLKPIDRPWQHFFLDVGAGFWEQWSDNADARTDESYRHVDYAERFGIRGATILEVRCEPVVPGGNSRIVVCFSGGTLVLAPEDAHDSESLSRLLFTSP